MAGQARRRCCSASTPTGSAHRLLDRLGQTILTCPTTACFDGLPDAPERVIVGGHMRHFGDKYQSSRSLDGHRYWRIPVMEGEFLIEEKFGVQKGIGGGNFLILGKDADVTLEAAEAAVDVMRKIPGVILPFPGGMVRAGSKVGAKNYKKLPASTNDAYCPTIRRRHGVKTELPEDVNSVIEIVIDGLNRGAIENAMRVGIDAACRPGRGRDHRRELRRQARQAPLPPARSPDDRLTFSRIALAIETDVPKSTTTEGTDQTTRSARSSAALHEERRAYERR